MNRNQGSLKKRLIEGDLIDRTRKRLTWQFSGMLIMFLSLFATTVYYLLFIYIYTDQRARLNKLADSEIEILQQWADQDSDPLRPPPNHIRDAFSISADQSFYYLITTDGSLNLADEIQPELRAQIMELIAKNRLFKQKRIEKFKLRITGTPSEQGHVKQEKIAIYFAHRDLLRNGERIGSLYIGKEVTFQYNLFLRLAMLLIGMTLLFFVLALWLGQRMSRKAMIPIAGAYARQREFAADASHELRTPLSVMLASIEALQLEESMDRDPFPRNVLRGMKHEVNSMTKLVGDLLHLARSDSGDFVPDRSLFNASEEAASAIIKLQPLAQSKGIAIKLHAPDKLTVNWDAEKLMQLLVLLIDNAIKYTPDKGLIDVTVTDGMEKGSHRLTIAVKDSGIGIPADALPRIFDRFYRQDKSRTRQSGGYGIGLAIARNIVNASGGTIHVDSMVGQGSTFVVQIPLNAAAGEPIG